MFLFPEGFIHVLLLPWILLILLILRPGGPEKSYDLNRRYAFGFLPGRWKEREFYVLWTRRLGVLWLIFFSALYAAYFARG